MQFVSDLQHTLVPYAAKDRYKTWFKINQKWCDIIEQCVAVAIDTICLGSGSGMCFSTVALQNYVEIIPASTRDCWDSEDSFICNLIHWRSVHLDTCQNTSTLN